MTDRRPLFLTTLSLISLLMTGAIFGFFYAWICSTMWGLDATDPRVAIDAMQAMNASVRNAVFFPTFFLTGPMLLITALTAHRANYRAPAALFAAAGFTYLIGGTGLTAVMNVPMNEALALVQIPQDIDAARAIWTDYSGPWQIYNTIRTVVSGGALLLTGLALLRL